MGRLFDLVCHSAVCAGRQSITFIVRYYVCHSVFS